MTNTIKNLTPHDINIVINGTITTIEKSGVVARVGSVIVPCGEINGIPLVITNWGSVIDLPAQEEGVFLIVSTLVKEKANRSDLLSPNGLVRDAAGNVVRRDGFKSGIGCSALSR